MPFLRQCARAYTLVRAAGMAAYLAATALDSDALLVGADIVAGAVVVVRALDALPACYGVPGDLRSLVTIFLDDYPDIEAAAGEFHLAIGI